MQDWIEFEEIADLEERAKSQFFEKVHEEVEKKTQEAAKEKEFLSVKAAPDVVGEVSSHAAKKVISWHLTHLGLFVMFYKCTKSGHLGLCAKVSILM